MQNTGFDLNMTKQTLETRLQEPFSDCLSSRCKISTRL